MPVFVHCDDLRIAHLSPVMGWTSTHSRKLLNCRSISFRVHEVEDWVTIVSQIWQECDHCLLVTSLEFCEDETHYTNTKPPPWRFDRCCLKDGSNDDDGCYNCDGVLASKAVVNVENKGCRKDSTDAEGGSHALTQVLGTDLRLSNHPQSLSINVEHRHWMAADQLPHALVLTRRLTL